MTAGPTLISDCCGSIDHLLFVFSEGLLIHEPRLVDTLLAIPPSWCFVTVVAPGPWMPWVNERLMQSNCARRADLISFEGTGLSAWSQDPFLVRKDPSGSSTLVFGSNKSVYGGLDDYLAKVQGIAGVASTTLLLDGGNILAGEGSLLVGADLVARWESLERGDDLASSCLGDLETQRRLVVVKGLAPIRKERPQRVLSGNDYSWREDRDLVLSTNGTYQPVFHIDMFINFAGAGHDGRERALVGDPKLAAEITGLPLPPGFPVQAFDDIAQSLTDNHISIWRNPLPIIAVDNHDRKTRDWIPLSYNNCLVQTSPSKGDIVWLPHYGDKDGLAIADHENQRVWRELGFEIMDAGNFLSVAPRLGSLRCLAKVLARTHE